MVDLTPERMPLVEALSAYVSCRPARLHVPGHKGGAAYERSADVRHWLGAVGVFDATELPGLDDLHAAHGPIRDAQQLAAQCFGAKRTYFLVGGSTVGNLSLLQTVAGRGDLVLMQRNVHKSAIHALMLNGAGAVFMTPSRDSSTGIYTGVTPQTVEEGLRAFPEVKAVFITNPNYYGMSTDVRLIAEMAHAYGKPLIVDEAHGAHFGLHRRLPDSALQAGADAVVQSTHKMLSAMTMGAMLHVQGDRIDERLLELRLGMLQSSSPSYPIMASLDWARREIHIGGETVVQRGLESADLLSRNINREGGRFAVWEGGTGEAYKALDPLKRLLYDRKAIISGYQLQELLTEEGCFVEMADERFAVCAFSPASTLSDAIRVAEAMEKIDLRFPVEKKEIPREFSNIEPLWPMSLSGPVYMNMDDITEAHAVPIEGAIDTVSAEMVTPYPPGIPLLYPGETVTEPIVQTLLRMREAGASIQGMKDATLQYIYVKRSQF